MSLVSVIMPAHNADATIAESIESVLNQSFPDFELIICDDGSTDNTNAIIKKYSDIDKRIILIESFMSRGAAETRNLCILKSRFKFICFLDSDDLWEKDKLASQVSFMQENNLAMTHGKYKMFDGGGLNKKIIPPKVISYSDLLRKCDIGCLTVMLDSEKIDSIRFPNVVKEDYALWLLIMRNGFSSYLYPGCEAYYRRRAGSVSSSKIKEIKKQLHVLKYVADISFSKRCFYILTYCVNGCIKHFYH
ncbi:glycosyltransferase family 2 protein [Symbiopectobacterium purcellii]|uniref:Glycosyltransferase family 2 protein n=1 Tax=Symbiopectobacterium purcellii TaxID=2871826 RepID=A0ABX9AQL1_9ENTR|nr:glycosyltransferase family 2 protein [Symbiopectobacterium purcellii]QZN97076.1 glycosyltransferase family 2 protein [Symbiopectobacterium purcellii]